MGPSFARGKTQELKTRCRQPAPPAPSRLLLGLAGAGEVAPPLLYPKHHSVRAPAADRYVCSAAPLQHKDRERRHDAARYFGRVSFCTAHLIGTVRRFDTPPYTPKKTRTVSTTAVAATP